MRLWIMPKFELNRREVERRLEREGWIDRGGAKHDLFDHPDRPGVVIVPRHQRLSMGVARSIAKAAGWI